MLPPNDQNDSTAESYNLPRGACPTCGSGEVIHLVIGMPAGPHSFSGDPDWVQWVGCIHPGYDRECIACGARWDSPGVEPTDQREALAGDRGTPADD